MRPEQRIAPLRWIVAMAMMALFGLSSPLAAQQGMISGVVFDVETNEGEPANRIPIALVGTSGTSTVATTGTGGSATVPYTSALPPGTRIQVVAVTVSGGMRIELVPDGQTSESCEEARQQNEDNCQELGFLNWGRTPNASYTLGRTFSEWVEPGGSGSGPALNGGEPTLAGGIQVFRSRELGSLRLGFRFTGTVPNGPAGGRWAWSGGVTRASVNSDVSVWTIEALGGIQLPLGGLTGPDLYVLGGPVIDRQSSEFGSGSETGVAVQVGVGKALGDSFKAGVFGGLATRRNSTDFEFGVAVVRQW